MKKSKGKLLPNSLRIISSCIKNVSTNASTAVRSAAASISSSADDRREQVLWAGFDKLELGSTSVRHVLLLGYLKGFQVFDVEDASGLSELVSRRDGPVTFLQMLPAPASCKGSEKYKSTHPVLVVVGGNEDERITGQQGLVRYGSAESSFESHIDPPTAVRFYSMKLNEYVKVIDFKSAVFMVRCSPQVVAIGLEEQIYCFDTLTLEKKFIVVTYPVPRVGEPGAFGINTGFGPMAVGPRWLAYPPCRPFVLNTGRVSPKSLASSVSPSTSPGSGSLMARYAMESGKHLAAGLLNLGDMGYKKFSKYYPELLPDGSSSPDWKSGKLAASESYNAGLIAVKDLVCSEVISQFRAHTSPISALCFDPSGTLLITASVYGNNINIFRIMPSHTCNGSGRSDWSTSYVHLYKLHRGLTTAVIQDICFSNYSQWIAVVSSRGTCHLFVLSPFGGDDGLHALKTHGPGTSLCLDSTPPWWSTSSFTINEQSFSPPPPCTLSVVTRIKCSDSGLVNSVSNVAASMVGKIWVPSGAVAAIFHNSSSTGTLDDKSRANALEHILVYTPSGFVVQHEIQLSAGVDLRENIESRSTLQVNQPNDEVRVKVEPIQWWDVCRRLDNLEREECISGSIFDGLYDPEIHDDSRVIVPENASSGEKKLAKSDILNSQERSHLYLSNAEVQINSSRSQIWQKPKMHFHLMEPPGAHGGNSTEFDIERVPSREVEIRHKDLLPVFDHFHSTRSGQFDRSVPSEKIYPNTFSDSYQTTKTNESSMIWHSKPRSLSSIESSEGGASRRIGNLLDLDHMSINRSPALANRSASNLNPEKADNINLQTSSMDQKSRPVIPSTMERTSHFGQVFKEGYISKPDVHDHSKPAKVVSDDVDTGGNDQDEKPEEEGWMGGMFDFSE